MTHDIQPDLFKNNIIAHAAIGKVFNLPTILTTSSETGWAHLFFFRLLKQPLDLMMMMILGPNGPLPREITAMHPNAPYIKRNGEVNAWDNEDFRKAVKATGKTQIIIAGITTDVSIANLNIPWSTRDAHKRWSFNFFQVCTAFLALSLIEEGYTVYANADASGALSERISSDANDRMRAAGVHVLSSFAVVLDLMRDWRNTPGALELLPYFDKWVPPPPT